MPSLCSLNTLMSLSVRSNQKSSDCSWRGGFQTSLSHARQQSYPHKLHIGQMLLFSSDPSTHAAWYSTTPLAGLFSQLFPSCWAQAGGTSPVTEPTVNKNYCAMLSSSPAAGETSREHPRITLTRHPQCHFGLSSSASYVGVPLNLNSCESCSMTMVLQGLMQWREVQRVLLYIPWHRSYLL